ncbi:MAG TPA: TIGR03619 family F420-dependent LLM class oxidoreductase [Acidimicrobiia bacterium]|nr:TIGR03619 family F420-dependent LLM class oxidoreductase [Acidimicrobiia bacterium]
MRYGLITPVILLNPRVVNEWEREADIDEVAAIAEAADRLGYHHLTASNHIAIPHEASARRGRRYWDPAVTLGFVAARTERIRLATFCLVLGYHHPLEIVKRYGTLDHASKGRVILGLGVGTLEPEFRMLGREFEGRGERADDALRAILASMGEREPEYHGTHYDFGDVTVDPSTLSDRVPIWIGGQSARSLRRAVEFGDAWVPFAVEPEEVASMLEAVRATSAWEERGRPLDVGLAPEPPLDPLGDPDRVRREIERHEACGATILNLRFRHDSLAHCLEQLEAFVAVAGPSD